MARRHRPRCNGMRFVSQISSRYRKGRAEEEIRGLRSDSAVRRLGVRHQKRGRNERTEIEEAVCQVLVSQSSYCILVANFIMKDHI